MAVQMIERKNSVAPDTTGKQGEMKKKTKFLKIVFNMEVYLTD
jgi:hypothetical protein